MITFSHLNKTFISRAGEVEALKDVSLTIEDGDIYGVIGFSGAGKSTLLRMANLLERPDSGTVTVDGQILTELSEKQLIPLRRKIGMVFQQFNLLESRTVAQNIEIPMRLAGIAPLQPPPSVTANRRDPTPSCSKPRLCLSLKSRGIRWKAPISRTCSQQISP